MYDRKIGRISAALKDLKERNSQVKVLLRVGSEGLSSSLSLCEEERLL